MYAVLIEVDVTGVDPDQGLKALREQIVPSIKAMPGFQSGTWLPGNDDGKGLSLTLLGHRGERQRHGRSLRDRIQPRDERDGRPMRGPRGGRDVALDRSSLRARFLMAHPVPHELRSASAACHADRCA
jgi:hypothetical protein